MKASVTSAKYVPRMRSAGRKKSVPPTIVATTAAGML